MEPRSERDINIGLGFATLADAFQSGREAAQMAKRELHSPDRVNIVMTLGPSSIHFSNYMEGVRLVTGGENLIGFPAVKHVMNDLLPPDSGLVAAIQTKISQVSLASASSTPENILSATTSLLSQFRQARGNVRHQFNFHGVIAFTNMNNPAPAELAEHLTADAGLDSWSLTIQVPSGPHIPIVCQDKTITSGIVALECLTNTPWGLSFVNLESFPKDPKTILEAARTAFREALNQMDGQEPAIGLLLVGSDTLPLTPSDLQHLMPGNVRPQVPFPIVALSCLGCGIRPTYGAFTSGKEILAALVVPR